MPYNRIDMDMPRLVSDLPTWAAIRQPEAPALVAGREVITYSKLVESLARFASGLGDLGVRRYDRVAIYLHKCSEHAVAMLGAARIGAVFVPVNPVLKPTQVQHILEDSNARFLVTSAARLDTLLAEGGELGNVEYVLLTDRDERKDIGSVKILAFSSLLNHSTECESVRPIEADIAAILYTSGSTGRPKGVVLSHKNIVTGALSVAEYLNNSPSDRILSVLPLSFDAGMSQLTTGLVSGAQVVLLDYLLPKDVVRACERHQITGITGVPPLWMQLMDQDWPPEASDHVRYFANTGGKMPRETLARLRRAFPKAEPYLMYGLTEAFRSTYLPPSQVDSRPDSIGKAIPNAEILVVRGDGSLCGPGEPGELVHRGPLVAMGYWNDPARTAERFKPVPGQPKGVPLPELAVWSGDTVVMDEEGFLYFIGRSDDMIKSSGYRVSPTEVEDIAFATGLVTEAAAVGVPDDRLGHKIVLFAKPLHFPGNESQFLESFRSLAPAYMVPASVVWLTELPRNTNGKIDRRALHAKRDQVEVE